MDTSRPEPTPVTDPPDTEYLVRYYATSEESWYGNAVTRVLRSATANAKWLRRSRGVDGVVVYQRTVTYGPWERQPKEH